MNKGMMRIWTLLAVLIAAAGCAGNPAGNAPDSSILSATDAELISVTVTPSKTDSLVAALNQEEE